MEKECQSNSLNQHLNQYVFHLQTKIGKTGKTLHQVISEYLEAQEKYKDLSKEMEGFEVQGCEEISAAQLSEELSELRNFQNLRRQIVQKDSERVEHPWKGLAHPGQDLDAAEVFIRSIRFAYIQLSKFWVEVQSFPLFLNAFQDVSIEEIEEIFRWIQNCGTWKDAVTQPRVIPALIQPESRKMLFDFMRNVKCVRALSERIATQQSIEFLQPSQIHTGFQYLSQAVTITHKYRLQQLNQEALQGCIDQCQSLVDHIQALQSFASAVDEETGFPLSTHPKEFRQMFQAAQMVRNIPDSLLDWRSPEIIDPQHLSRIQLWQSQAQPLLEARQKLEKQFQLHALVSVEGLQELARVFQGAGIFRIFKGPYRDAVKTYRSLLSPSKAQARREGPKAMASQLLSWAAYLEELQVFDTHAEMKVAFGSLFEGLDTNFNAAVEANLWANQVRSQLHVHENHYGGRIAEFIFSASEDQLKSFTSLVSELRVGELEKELAKEKFLENHPFSHTLAVEQERLTDYHLLQQNLQRLRIPGSVVFSALDELKAMNEEVIFLSQQMDSQQELKNCLKNSYQGVYTDLSIIERAMNYIQFIHQGKIPAKLKNSFLSIQGPQKFDETQQLMNSAMKSLSAVHELFSDLNDSTQGRVQEIIHLPIPELLNRIQIALRQPTLLPSWVEYLKSEQKTQEQGLAEYLDYMSRHDLSDRPWDVSYQLALNSSLLKKFIGEAATRAVSRDLHSVLQTTH